MNLNVEQFLLKNNKKNFYEQSSTFKDVQNVKNVELI